MRRPVIPKRILISSILILAAIGVFYFHAGIYRDWTEDDAFITYRYARNIVAGEGLVFNPGERVEGYSNFLWLMMITAGMRLGVDPIVLSKTVGLIGGIIAMVLSWFLALRLSGRFRWSAFFVPFYISVSPMLVRHSVSGLETGFFAALLAASVLTAAGGSDASFVPGPGRRLARSILLVFFLVLLSMTRLEGPLFAVIIIIVRTFFILRARGNLGFRSARGILIEAIIYLSIFGTYYIWRWNYFGSFLANTCYAKMCSGIPGIIDGVQYTAEFIRDGGGPLFIGLALVPSLFRRYQPAYWLYFAVMVFNMAVIIFSGGDWMFSYRFFAHTLVIMAPMIARGGWYLTGIRITEPPRKWLIFPVSAVLAMTVLLSISSAEWRMSQLVLPAVRQHNYLAQNYEELGRWFRDNSRPDETIAISDVGAIAYYSERTIIDMFGLTTPRIARKQGRMHYKSDPEYILSKKPDYIVLVPLYDPYGGYSFLRVPDRQISVLPEFKERYEKIRSVPQYWNNETVLIYKRKIS